MTKRMRSQMLAEHPLLFMCFFVHSRANHELKAPESRLSTRGRRERMNMRGPRPERLPRSQGVKP
jgi:hypothetical protein